MRFEISNMRRAVGKAREVGIQANFDLEAYAKLGDADEEVLIVRMKDLTLRTAKSSGNAFISSPSRQYESEGEKRYVNYVTLFPENRDLQDKLRDKVVNHLDTLPEPAAATASSKRSSSSSEEDLFSF